MEKNVKNDKGLVKNALVILWQKLVSAILNNVESAKAQSRKYFL